MDQEEKIEELEYQMSEMKRRFCDMSLCLHPMYIEWQKYQEHEAIISRMFLDG